MNGTDTYTDTYDEASVMHRRARIGHGPWGSLRRIALTACFGVIASACAGRARVPAPTGAHTAEPVAPLMMPAAEVVAAPSARAVLRHLADSAIASPIWRNARWGVLLVDAASGDTLYAHDAERLFMPASNQKLLTAAVALQVLGPEHRWRTPVLLRGTQSGSVFRGDIVVVGSGDPSVSDTLRAGNALSAFDPVVSALKARGITRIVGDIVTDGDAFPGLTTGFGWEVDDLDEPYGAGVDELFFNEGFLAITVRGATTAGKKPSVTSAPLATYPLLMNEATTRAASDTGSRVRVAYDSTGSVLRVTGTIAIGDSVQLSASYRHPGDAYRAALRERLMAQGVAFRSAKPTPVGARTDTLVVLESLSLREILPRMQKPSQNQIAELLFRSSGLAGSGSGSADSARAVAARTLALWGVGTTDVAYRDGSGMSRHDYVSPRAIVQVLDAMHRSPFAQLYREALPLAGVDGTIANRMKNTLAAGNANAKTGTVDKARSLSGYVTTADGRLVLFSMLCNNFTVPNREVERVQDLLVATVAGLRVDDGTLRGR